VCMEHWCHDPLRDMLWVDQLAFVVAVLRLRVKSNTPKNRFTAYIDLLRCIPFRSLVE